MSQWVGAPPSRNEDGRLLTGRGRYVDDLSRPGLLHAAMLRSPHAHARGSCGHAGRRGHAGVLAVLAGAEAGQALGPIRP